MGSNIAIVFAGGLPPEGGCSSPQRLRVESRSILSSAETSTDSGDLSYNHHHCQQQRINNENRTLSEDSNLLDVCPRVPQDIIRLSEAAWQYYASHLWYLLISILIIFSSQSHHILIIFSSNFYHIVIIFYMDDWEPSHHDASFPNIIVDPGADLSGGRCNGRLQRTRRVEAEVEIDLCGVWIRIRRGIHIRIHRGIPIRICRGWGWGS